MEIIQPETKRTWARLKGTWQCPQCGKQLAVGYRYKTHLEKCLVHQEKMKLHSDFLKEVRQELKQEMYYKLNNVIEEVENLSPPLSNSREGSKQPSSYINVKSPELILENKTLTKSTSCPAETFNNTSHNYNRRNNTELLLQKKNNLDTLISKMFK